jgi:hypothetical protein
MGSGVYLMRHTGGQLETADCGSHSSPSNAYIKGGIGCIPRFSMYSFLVSKKLKLMEESK